MYIPISVVIPTCERKLRLLSLLQNLAHSNYPVKEVIVVDAGNDKLLPEQYAGFKNLDIKYVDSPRSVCIQRNTGIKLADSSWVLLCDDDVELPADYIGHLAEHSKQHEGAVAISGIWLEKQAQEWKAGYELRSARQLVWKYIFRLGIWGEIACRNNNWLIRKIRSYYERKGNHISTAGWPVNTQFNGNGTTCPIYSLGASLVRKEWLLQVPFDEVLDRHGIGDNYGVACELPGSIHIVSKAKAYHHQETINRLNKPVQYYRRILALDYFIKTRKRLVHVKRRKLLWSLTGNFLSFLVAGKFRYCKATLKSMWLILFNRNPYVRGARKEIKTIEPQL